MKEFGPGKVSKDVRSEGLDQHGSELLETQLPVKFHPKRITKSKFMTLKNPCIKNPCQCTLLIVGTLMQATSPPLMKG
jgi:hypothetical protein